MTAPPLLLDTNTISALMRDATGVLASRVASAHDAGQPVLTSVVVQCELLFGLAKRPSPRLQAGFDAVMRRIEVVSLDASAAVHYAVLREHLERNGTPIGPNDTLIAAHALALGATLVTDNEDEFRRVQGLAVENWLRL